LNPGAAPLTPPSRQQTSAPAEPLFGAHDFPALEAEGSSSGALQRSGGGGSSQPGWGDLLDTLEDPSLQETLKAHFKRLEDELKALHKDKKKYLQRELAESFRTTPVAALRQDDWQPARAAGFLKEQKLTKELKEIKDAFSRQKTAHHKDQRELKAVRALLEEARQQQAAQGREVAGLQGRAEVAEEARGELLAINAQLMEELKSSREALEHRGSFESVIQQFADVSIPGAGGPAAKNSRSIEPQGAEHCSDKVS